MRFCRQHAELALLGVSSHPDRDCRGPTDAQGWPAAASALRSPPSLFLGGMCAVPPCCAVHHLASLSACASCIYTTPPLPFRPNPLSTSLPTHHQPLWRCPSCADGGAGCGAAAVMGCWRSSLAMLLSLAAELLLLPPPLLLLLAVLSLVALTGGAHWLLSLVALTSCSHWLLSLVALTGCSH
jgi:hypothetical protein